VASSCRRDRCARAYSWPRMLSGDRDCAHVLTHLAAVPHAVDRAYLLIAQRLREVVTAERAGADYREAVLRLERSFLSLA
jgi:DNA-binding FrmR family transcriptional regulator